MQRLRWLLFPALALLLTGATLPSKDDIVLPEILAIEMPRPRLTEIAPTETPLKELLGSASARGLIVTHDRVAPLPIGGTLITWTAWEGKPHKSPARRSKSTYVYVFPFGQTPAGVSGDDHATAGNHSAKIVRDGDGKIHVAWLDGGRDGRGHRVLYRRGVQDFAKGTISWETEPLRVSDAQFEAWNSYVVLAAGENSIHFVWNGLGSSRYRRLVRTGTTWKFEPIRSTRADGEGHDNSPDLAVRGDDEIHVLTPTGNYAISTDGGRSWKVDQVPRPSYVDIKNPALAVDSQGNAHVAFTGIVRGPLSSSSSKTRGYWQLRYIRREPGGRWVDAQDVLAPFARWSEPKDASDILSDWADIAVDKSGTIHIAWHGTVNTHIYGNDEAFYSHRPMKAEGAWGVWAEPQALHPINPSKGEYFSFAPSLAIDDGNRFVVAVVFFDTSKGGHALDVDARVIRNGTVGGAPIVLSRLARLPNTDGKTQKMSTWFPVANPRIFRGARGDAWLDVLSTAVPPEEHKSPKYVLYHRLELTSFLGKSSRSLALSAPKTQAQSNCDCTKKLASCQATITLDKGSFTLAGNTSQCAVVDWVMDGRPKTTILQNGRATERRVETKSNPDFVLKGCSICANIKSAKVEKPPRSASPSPTVKILGKWCTQDKKDEQSYEIRRDSVTTRLTYGRLGRKFDKFSCNDSLTQCVGEINGIRNVLAREGIINYRYTFSGQSPGSGKLVVERLSAADGMVLGTTTTGLASCE